MSIVVLGLGVEDFGVGFLRVVFLRVVFLRVVMGGCWGEVVVFGFV
jgi:hypothetical protein